MLKFLKFLAVAASGVSALQLNRNVNVGDGDHKKVMVHKTKAFANKYTNSVSHTSTHGKAVRKKSSASNELKLKRTLN